MICSGINAVFQAEFILNHPVFNYKFEENCKVNNKNIFDTSLLKLKKLSERKHDLHISIVKELSPVSNIDAKIKDVAGRIIKAKNKGASVILMMGGHVVRSGVQKYVIDLMERGYISCIAMNGSVIIHDFEFSLIGETTESVAEYIKKGEFGLWKETGILNDIISQAYREDEKSGMGEAVGKYIEVSRLPYRESSILAASYRLDIPATVHIGVGYDIIHEHPNFDGAATGALSYNDFLRYASVVGNLENGVVMNFGSSVMAPEVYLKALSMARNVALQEGKEIKHFTTLVCDLLDLPEDFKEDPPKSNPVYYFRPLKTMLIRTVADGGESFYVKGKHGETIPGLWTSINEKEA